MRVLKFRQAVYSKDKFHHWHEWGFLPDLTFVGPDSLNGLAHALANSQQYTGLKDKNGKEVWDSDIIKECVVGQVIWDGKGVVEKCPCAEVVIGSIHTGIGKRKKGRVKLKKGGFSDVNMSTYDGLYEWPNDVEVIGNIHQHPELLDG